jgi:hypothetical protein
MVAMWIIYSPVKPKENQPMPAMAFSDFNSLPDVLAVDRFELLLSPSGSSTTNQVLAVRCIQLNIPQEQTEVMPVNIQGMEFNFRGRRIYDKAITAVFVETVDGAIQKAIRTWTQQVVGSESGNGATKKNYATQGTINVFDQSGNTSLLFLVDNIWPSDIAQMQLDGGQANPYMQSVTFTYDRLQPPELNGSTLTMN